MKLIDRMIRNTLDKDKPFFKEIDGKYYTLNLDTGEYEPEESYYE